MNVEFQELAYVAGISQQLHEVKRCEEKPRMWWDVTILDGKDMLESLLSYKAVLIPNQNFDFGGL